MSNYPKMAAEFGDRYLDAMSRTQESTLKYVAAMRNFAAPVPSRKSPLAVDHASLREVTDTGFAFLEKLLDQQRDFSRRLLAMPSASTAPTPPAPAEPKVEPETKPANAQSSGPAADKPARKRSAGQT